jgi:hypothetical protein
VAGPGEITIRAWQPRAREAVEGLLELLSGDAVVVSDDAPASVAAAPAALRASGWIGAY